MKSDFQILIGDKVKVVNGTLFEAHKCKLGLHKDNLGWRVTDLRSGRALTNGDKTQKAAKESLEATRKRIGVRKFNKTLKDTRSIKDQLSFTAKRNKEWNDARELFHKKFRKTLPMDALTLYLTGAPSLDILKFDTMLEWIDERYHASSSTWDVNGPDCEDNFSMRDALYRICGDDMAKIIENLITTRSNAKTK